MTRFIVVVAAIGCGGRIVTAQDAGADAQPSCATRIMTIDSPVDLAIDDAHAYVVSSQGRVVTTTKDGAVSADIASAQQSPFAVAVDTTSVYWTTQGDRGLWSASLPSGAPAMIFAFIATPRRVTAYGGFVFVAHEGGIDRATGATIVTSPDPRDLVTDGTSLYWTDGQSGTVSKVAVSGGIVSPIASSSAPERIAIDAARIYWTDRAEGTVSSVSKIGGGVSIIATNVDPRGLAVDGTNVYWTDAAGRITKAAGGKTTVLCELDGAGALAVDATTLFVLAGNALYRVP